MKLFLFQDLEEVGQAVGAKVCDFVRSKPNAVLGLATGASPLGAYQEMVRQHQAGLVSFADVTTFNLDEYCGISIRNSCSYHAFMYEHVFSNLDILLKNTHFLNGNTRDEAAESRRYAERIETAGGIDLQLLGIGRNGHIAFNEPSAQFTEEAFRVELTESTRTANRKHFPETEQVPRYAMTMGIRSILRAKQIFLLATGVEKINAIRTLLRGELTPSCPATALQSHEHLELFIDQVIFKNLKI